MEKLTKIFEKIPWSSFGRKTPISELARSVVPVGNHKSRLPSQTAGRAVRLGEPDYEAYLMEIVGTAFQVGRGKLLTCWHVCTELAIGQGRAYIQYTSDHQGVWRKSYWPVQAQFSFIDPRHSRGNSDVDVGVLICAALEERGKPYDAPVVSWGDSTQLGVGDPVLIGGYPLGREMFLSTGTNRGIVQPTFYNGIISAIIPAARSTETRLLQISSIALGGISGGVVCSVKTGKVLGMVTSGLEHKTTGQSLPITYAIPSEVLQPYVDAISFRAEDGQTWR